MSDPLYLGDPGAVLEGVLAVVCEALDSTKLGRPDECRVYHGAPPDDCCGFAAVWLQRILPTVNFPLPFTGFDTCSTVRPMLEIGIRVVRSCWPMGSGASPATAIPPSAETNDMALALSDDPWFVFCALLGAGDFDGKLCNGVAWRSADVKNPQGGCAGWTLFIAADLDPCCM